MKKITEQELRDITAKETGGLYKDYADYCSKKELVIARLQGEYPCYVAEYWHSNKDVTLVVYKGISKSKATRFAKRFGWTGKRPILRVVTEKYMKTMNEGFSPREWVYHDMKRIIRFSDKRAIEPVFIDGSAFTIGV